jgi:hypothetical protein
MRTLRNCSSTPFGGHAFADRIEYSRVKEKTMLCIKLLAIGALAVSCAPVFGQTGPSISTAHATEITVDGVAATGSGPIYIIDTFYKVETRIGRGVVSRDGKFAAVVKPALIEGHTLVAVDRSGRRSAVFTVEAARNRSGATPAPPAAR